MNIVKNHAIRVLCVVAVLATPITAGSATRPASHPANGGLVGTWLGAGCTLVFLKDDGAEVEGNCDNIGVRHKFNGRYTADNKVEITITRIDQNKCATTAKGFVTIVNSDAIDVFQEGWNGCGVRTGPAATRLQRS